ncbi:MAG: hypothetical protein IT285_15250 [Bdellovibrionales bacterium]|nr:hypothetical protein [Bdellovibrionales bacterium]
MKNLECLRSLSLSLALALSLSAASSARADDEKPAGPVGGASNYVVALGGTVVGAAREISGGMPVGGVVTQNAGGAIPDKFIGSVSIPSTELRVGHGVSPAFMTWVQESFQGSGSGVQKDLEAYTCDVSNRMIRRRSWLQSRAIALRFPGANVVDRTPGTFVVGTVGQEFKLEPQGSGNCPQVQPSQGDRQWILSNFRVDLNGATQRGVVAMDPFEVTLSGSAGSGFQASGVNISNLKLTVSAREAREFEKWYEQAILGEQQNESQERTLSLAYLNPNLSKELVRVEFDGVGIVGLEYEDAGAGPGAERTAKVIVTLYAETLNFKINQP